MKCGDMIENSICMSTEGKSLCLQESVFLSAEAKQKRCMYCRYVDAKERKWGGDKYVFHVQARGSDTSYPASVPRV